MTPLTSFLCRLYFNTSSTVCDGGLVAVNGSNGAVLWTTWLDDVVFAIHCIADLDLDGILDCMVTGKSGVLRECSVFSPKCRVTRFKLTNGFL